MKIGVYLDELYPVVLFDEKYSVYEIEVDEKLIKRSKKALKLFYETQEELLIKLYRMENK